MGDVRLSLPRVIVVRDGFDDLELQVANPDLLRWDKTRVRHKWPEMRQAPNLWLTFVSWTAARRVGAIPADLKYEVWEEVVLEVRNLQSDEDDDDLVGAPFPEDPEPGSS